MNKLSWSVVAVLPTLLLDNRGFLWFNSVLFECINYDNSNVIVIINKLTTSHGMLRKMITI